jgi:Zn-dependent protease with chaperone function
MNYSASAIEKLFGGKLNIHKELRNYVIHVVQKLPDDLITHITADCWFLGSTEDAWAYTFRGDEIAGKHLIVLSDRLLTQPPEDIEWTIMHEIGHVILGHQNSILVTQTKADIARQEKEADNFAQRHLGI